MSADDFTDIDSEMRLGCAGVAVTDEIETAARQLCTARGEDADGLVLCNVGDDLTDPELFDYLLGDPTGFLPVCPIHVPRWRLYRRAAARALASKPWGSSCEHGGSLC